MPAGETRRLFFALWPEDGLRRRIIERRETLGRLQGRRVPDQNLHLTLVFLGDQPRAMFDRILDAADTVAGDPFEIRLDRFGYFPGTRVVWLGGEAPEAATALVGDLVAAMESIELAPDRRPWRPHITLFRNVNRRPRFMDCEPVIWPVRAFSLVESIPGRPYQLLRSWPLISETD